MKHPQNACRKELIRIKHLLTQNMDFFAQMPFDRICYSFLEFKKKFNCSEVSEKFSNFSRYNERFRKDRKLYREYIQTSLEIDPVYFWNRLCLLEQIYQFSSDEFEIPKLPIQGKWKDKKYLHWERATKSSLQMILYLAQGDLLSRFDEDGFVNETQALSWPIDETFKFTRRACDGYLDRLLTHTRPILLNVKETENNDQALSEVIVKKTRPQQKTEELVKHTKDYWDKFPTASYKQVYEYYCDCCRFNPYSIDEWERKFRKLMLDPRPRKEKVRGFSEKEALKK